MRTVDGCPGPDERAASCETALRSGQPDDRGAPRGQRVEGPLKAKAVDGTVRLADRDSEQKRQSFSPLPGTVPSKAE